MSEASRIQLKKFLLLFSTKSIKNYKRNGLQIDSAYYKRRIYVFNTLKKSILSPMAQKKGSLLICTPII